MRRLAVSIAACAALGLSAAAQTPAPANSEAIVYPRGHAASTTAQPAATTTARPSTAWLVAGLALTAAGGWFWWRQRHGAGLPGRTAQNLAIEETRSLGNRQFLLVVSHRDRRFLLGVCPGSIAKLADLSPPAGGDSSS